MVPTRIFFISFDFSLANKNKILGLHKKKHKWSISWKGKETKETKLNAHIYYVRSSLI